MRHPIERLLSAYRDRVAGLKISYDFYARLAKALKLTRTDTILPGKKKGAATGAGKRIAVPTWPEFVSFILQTDTRHNVGPLAPVTSLRLIIMSLPGPSLEPLHLPLLPLSG